MQSQLLLPLAHLSNLPVLLEFLTLEHRLGSICKELGEGKQLCDSSHSLRLQRRIT